MANQILKGFILAWMLIHLMEKANDLNPREHVRITLTAQTGECHQYLLLILTRLPRFHARHEVDLFMVCASSQAVEGV